jgi:alanine dehydrogenase
MVSESADVPTVAPMPAMRRSQSVALMIVGGAGMIVGSLIDGDTGTIIMVGGGVIGLVGLFQYLR